MDECGHCHKQLDSRKVCSKCKSISYCSRECQSNDWRIHKQGCNQLDCPVYMESRAHDFGIHAEVNWGGHITGPRPLLGKRGLCTEPCPSNLRDPTRLFGLGNGTTLRQSIVCFQFAKGKRCNEAGCSGTHPHPPSNEEILRRLEIKETLQARTAQARRLTLELDAILKKEGKSYGKCSRFDVEKYGTPEMIKAMHLTFDEHEAHQAETALQR